MKRYCSFNTIQSDGTSEYFTFDVTQISLLTHKENEGVHGTTTIAIGLATYNFSGIKNKSIFDGIQKIIQELDNTN